MGFSILLLEREPHREYTDSTWTGGKLAAMDEFWDMIERHCTERWDLSSGSGDVAPVCLRPASQIEAQALMSAAEGMPGNGFVFAYAVRLVVDRGLWFYPSY